MPANNPSFSSRKFAVWVEKYVLTIAAVACFHSGSALALGQLVDLEVVDRTDARVLQVYQKDGQYWVVGTPGHEYLLRIRNNGGGRVLAVASVDGVNVVSGETATPTQSGYVVDTRGSVEIGGWRTSLARTASFYFTEIEDAYATRTGRPDNLGVIGVAVFRERAIRVSDATRLRKDGAMREDRPAQTAAPAAERAEANAQGKASASSDARQESAGRLAAAPAPAVGTGYGRGEDAPAQRVRFERDSADPAEVVTMRYDRRENLIAMGVLPSAVASLPRPFPGWNRGFVPAPQ